MHERERYTRYTTNIAISLAADRGWIPSGRKTQNNESEVKGRGKHLQNLRERETERKRDARQCGGLFMGTTILHDAEKK